MRSMQASAELFDTSLSTPCTCLKVSRRAAGPPFITDRRNFFWAMNLWKRISKRRLLLKKRVLRGEVKVSPQV